MKAKARTRKQAAGYQHRIAAAASNLAILRGVSHAVIQHDHWCAVFQRHACDCVPDMTVVNGDTLLVIDALGAICRTGKQ